MHLCQLKAIETWMSRCTRTGQKSFLPTHSWVLLWYSYPLFTLLGNMKCCYHKRWDIWISLQHQSLSILPNHSNLPNFTLFLHSNHFIFLDTISSFLSLFSFKGSHKKKTPNQIFLYFKWVTSYPLLALLTIFNVIFKFLQKEKISKIGMVISFKSFFILF